MSLIRRRACACHLTLAEAVSFASQADAGRKRCRFGLLADEGRGAVPRAAQRGSTSLLLPAGPLRSPCCNCNLLFPRRTQREPAPLLSCCCCSLSPKRPSHLLSSGAQEPALYSQHDHCYQANSDRQTGSSLPARLAGSCQGWARSGAGLPSVLINPTLFGCGFSISTNVSDARSATSAPDPP